MPSPPAIGIGLPPPAPQRTVLCPGKLVKLLLCGSNKSEEGVILQFYPHFSTFLTHVTSHALRTYLCLHCTHMHYPLCPRSRLVPYSCAMASYHDSFIYDSLVPFSTIHLPHLVRFLIPAYIITFYSHQKPYASFLDPILYLASFTVSPFVPSFRLRPFPVYKPLSRHLCLSSLT
jgi:hypothetical protein